MKTAVDSKSRATVTGTQEKLMRSSTVASEVLTSTARNIQLIQSNAGAQIFTRGMENLISAFSFGGSPYWIQQLPLYYRMQAATVMTSVANTYVELLEAQQTLMEMSSQPPDQSDQESIDATNQSLNKFYNRRVSRKVIPFPERRVA